MVCLRSLAALIAGCIAFAALGEALPAPSAADAHFYYTDLERAERFYREQLGLVPVARRDGAVVLEVAPGAFLTLATFESGGYSPDTPRTAAIALVTDQLDAWWAALSVRDLDMRTENYDPVAGRAHHGFVLADPEGWLLEFERFNQHPENAGLMPRLDSVATRPVDAAAAGLPPGLGFKATVLWFYYEDLASAEEFVVGALGLPLVTDQGWAKIHPVADAAYLGLVDGARGMHAFTEEKAVALELRVPDVAAQRRALEARGVSVEQVSDTVIGVRDAGDYRIRWRTAGGS